MSVIERLLGRDAGGGIDGATMTLGGVTIEPMRRRDVRRGVLAIEDRSYPKPWSPGVFDSELAQVRSGARCYLVAHRGRAVPGGRRSIVGYAGLWLTGDEAHVTNVAVDPEHRRTGVATALMLALAEESIRRRCAAWTLEVRVSSAGAQALYRRFGFVPAGVRSRYYENTEDAIVMWCNDIQGDDYRALLDRERAELEAARP